MRLPPRSWNAYNYFQHMEMHGGKKHKTKQAKLMVEQGMGTGRKLGHKNINV